RDVIDGAAFHRVYRVLDAAMAGDHDDVDLRPATANLLCQLDTVLAADAYVDQSQRALVLRQVLDRLADTGHATHLIRLTGKKILQFVPDQGIVVDDEKARFKSHRSALQSESAALPGKIRGRSPPNATRLPAARSFDPLRPAPHVPPWPLGQLPDSPREWRTPSPR